jgi:hypothetical protein
LAAALALAFARPASSRERRLGARGSRRHLVHAFPGVVRGPCLRVQVTDSLWMAFLARL